MALLFTFILSWVPLIGPVQAIAQTDRVDPLAVLHEWDRDREAAYLAADPTKLAALYVSGSSAAAADLAIMDTYRERGLRVQRISQQFFSVQVLAVQPARIKLRTVERFAGGLVLGEGRCQQLAPTFPVRREVALVHDGNRWRVESVSR